MLYILGLIGIVGIITGFIGIISCNKEEKTMDINRFKKEITKREGKKQSLDIAQIGEVLKITKDIIKEKTGLDIYSIIKKIK